MEQYFTDYFHLINAVNITAERKTIMIFTSKYGFLTENNGIENACALQKAVDNGGDIYIDLPGVYELADTIYIGDDTSIIFCNGAYIKRVKNNNETGPVFINAGAYKKEVNKNIKIVGMKLICDGVVSDEYKVGCKKGILGISAHIAFHYIKNLEIHDFEVHDLPAKDFAVQICNFDNILVENGVIEGLKDGVHLGVGSGFTIRHFKFRTFDDPIALNAHDYAISNPEMGWIENGIIEDCYDLDDASTTGYFCRILAGAWKAWESGMIIQNSDSVIYNGKIYRAFMKPDGKTYISNEAPDKNEGKENPDGIVWCMVQENTVNNCGCRNIVFRNIFLQKKRPMAFSIHFDKDEWSRSYYPGSEAPIQENIAFENIYCQNQIPVLLYSRTPMNNIRFVNCFLNGNMVKIEDIDTEGIEYKTENIGFDKTSFSGTEQDLIIADESIPVKLQIANSFADKNFSAKLKGNISVDCSDIKLNK